MSGKRALSDAGWTGRQPPRFCERVVLRRPAEDDGVRVDMGGQPPCYRRRLWAIVGGVGNRVWTAPLRERGRSALAAGVLIELGRGEPTVPSSPRTIDGTSAGGSVDVDSPFDTRARGSSARWRNTGCSREWLAEAMGGGKKGRAVEVGGTGPLRARQWHRVRAHEGGPRKEVARCPREGGGQLPQRREESGPVAVDFDGDCGEVRPGRHGTGGDAAFFRRRV